MSKRDKQDKFVQRSLSQQAWIQFRNNRLAICGLVVIALLILVSITTMLIDLADGGELYKVLVTKNNLSMKLAKPSAAHILGCDEYGRDLLFRLLWGTRYSLFAGICTILAAILIGGVFGSIAGFYGGKIDNVIMRFMDMVMTPVAIALLNTVFRVVTVVVLFPFIPKLEKLVCILVKDSAEELEDEADFDLLEERLLNYPALAIAQCHRAMNGMAKKLRKNVNRAMNLLNEYQQDKFDKVQRKEDLIDKYESRLGEYLIQLTKREMNTAQTRQVSLYLHTIGDFERIGDHASYIAHMSNEMHDNHTDFSPAAWNELNIVMEAVREEINITCNAFLNDDKEAAQRVAPLGVVITHLCDELKMHHVERLSNGNCGLEEGTVFNDILNSFGRIASHCASAMVALMKSGEQDPDMHIRDSKIYPTDSFEYYTYFSEYKKKYDITDKGEEHVLSMEPEEIE